MKKLILTIKAILLAYFSFNLIRGILSFGTFTSSTQLLIAFFVWAVVLFDVSSKYYIKSLPKFFYNIKPIIGYGIAAFGLNFGLSLLKGELNYMFQENTSNIIYIFFLLLPILIIVYGLTFASQLYELKKK